MVTPIAVRAPGRDELERRQRLAAHLLSRCELCGLRCGVNRLGGERGRCGLGAEARVYKRYISYNEEPELVPALRLFLGGCNFRCAFCDEAPEAFDGRAGEALDPTVLAAELADAVACGVKSVSVLGGEPTLHVHALLSIAAAARRPLPLAVNTNLFMSPHVLGLLEGVVHWYLADLKFGNDDCARRIARIPDYSAVVRENLARARDTANVIVRHVLLPGHGACCFEPLVEWLENACPRARFELYPGYVPCGPAARDPMLGRLVTRQDVERAVVVLRGTALRWNVHGLSGNTGSAQESPHACGTARITIGRDGRVFCHDLSARLIGVLAELCAGDVVLERQPQTEERR